jgi:hypothetical protein
MINWDIVWQTLADPTQMLIEFIWNSMFEIVLATIVYKLLKKKLGK